MRAQLLFACSRFLIGNGFVAGDYDARNGHMAELLLFGAFFSLALVFLPLQQLLATFAVGQRMGKNKKEHKLIERN